MKFDDYEDLRDGLKELPMTWYPDLIKTLVEASMDKSVFVANGGVAKFVEIVEREKRKSN